MSAYETWLRMLAQAKNSSAGKFASGAASMFLPEKLSDVVTGPAYAVRHPIDSASMLWDATKGASQDQFERMYNAPTTSEAIGHGLAGAIPLMGPAAAASGEAIGEGRTAEGLGMAAGLLAPSLYHMRPELKATPSIVSAEQATLPTRRTALKVGAGAGAAAMLPKLLEVATKTPEAAAVAEAAPRGLAAPSALGREGFYRELKYRAGMPWGGDIPEARPIQSIDQLVTNVRDGRASEVPDYTQGVHTGDRFFLTRAEIDGPDGIQYIKQVNKVHPYESLRAALRDFNKHNLGEAAYTSGRYDDEGLLTPKRIVHSEITPEAALRLNTIEKPKLTMDVVDKNGKSLKTQPDVFNEPDKWDFVTVTGGSSEDSWKNYTNEPASIVAVPKGTANISKKLGIERYEAVDADTAKAMMREGPYNPVSRRIVRPDTVGISPRYTKRVTIRLLKDTLAKQIAENKRAAGKTPPPLLAKPPLLSDNPLLSRQEFFAGLRKKP